MSLWIPDIFLSSDKIPEEEDPLDMLVTFHEDDSSNVTSPDSLYNSPGSGYSSPDTLEMLLTDSSVSSNLSLKRGRESEPPPLPDPQRKESTSLWDMLSTFGQEKLEQVPMTSPVPIISTPVLAAPVPPLSARIPPADPTDQPQKKKSRKSSTRINDSSIDTSGLSKKERNKLSAAKYRAKKKNYVAELEDKMKQLEQTIQQQNSLLSSLSAENKLLREHVAQLQQTLGVTVTPDSNLTSSSRPSPSASSFGVQQTMVLFALFSCLLLFAPPEWGVGLDLTPSPLEHHIPTRHGGGRNILSVDIEDVFEVKQLQAPAYRAEFVHRLVGGRYADINTLVDLIHSLSKGATQLSKGVFQNGTTLSSFEKAEKVSQQLLQLTRASNVCPAPLPPFTPFQTSPVALN